MAIRAFTSSVCRNALMWVLSVCCPFVCRGALTIFPVYTLSGGGGGEHGVRRGCVDSLLLQCHTPIGLSHRPNKRMHSLFMPTHTILLQDAETHWPSSLVCFGLLTTPHGRPFAFGQFGSESGLLIWYLPRPRVNGVISCPSQVFSACCGLRFQERAHI